MVNDSLTKRFSKNRQQSAAKALDDYDDQKIQRKPSVRTKNNNTVTPTAMKTVELSSIQSTFLAHYDPVLISK